jgi:rod shape-determining protein MreC
MRIRDFLFRKYAIPTVLLLLLLSSLILISLRVKERRGVAFMDGLLMEICSPFQKGSTFVINKVKGVWEGYLFLVNLHRENEQLKKKIAELQRENARMQEAALAHERLRKLLEFKETLSPMVIAAEVIGRDPTSWFKSVTINKGEKDGIRKGMAVISPEGMVGQILKASPSHSVVLLITDYNSAVDSIVQRTRAKAIVEGKGENRCQLKYLLRADDVVVGDKVITSGLVGNFPKGVMIGEVIKVDKKGHGIFQHAELVPSVDFTRLEEVLIVKESPPPPPPAEQKSKKVKKTK